MQNDIVRKQLTYNLFIPRVGGGVLQVKYLLPCSCIHDSIKFDMEHDNLLKKLSIELLTPRVVGVCEQNIAIVLLHFVISFNLICNMTMF